MVRDPKDYRWSGYAEAVAGGKLARNGVMRVLNELDSDTAHDGWSGARNIGNTIGAAWRSATGSAYSKTARAMANPPPTSKERGRSAPKKRLPIGIENIPELK